MSGPNGGKLDRALEAYAESASRVSKKPDSVTKAEIDHEKLLRYRVRTAGIEADNGGRVQYAKLTFRLIVWWLAGLFLLLFLQGFLSESPSEYQLPNGAVFRLSFRLSQPVLLMLLGTSTATIIGLFASVMRYLFPRSTPEANDEIEERIDRDNSDEDEDEPSTDEIEEEREVAEEQSERS